LGTMHTRGRELPAWRWPVGPKFDFDRMAAPVPEIMDGFFLGLLCQLPSYISCA
jgi:hypothetical protein